VPRAVERVLILLGDAVAEANHQFALALAASSLWPTSRNQMDNRGMRSNLHPTPRTLTPRRRPAHPFPATLPGGQIARIPGPIYQRRNY
jgi:hypothetical protein